MATFSFDALTLIFDAADDDRRGAGASGYGNAEDWPTYALTSL